MNTTQHNSC